MVPEAVAVHLELAGTAEEVLVTFWLFPLLQGNTVRDVAVQRRTSRSGKMETGFTARLRATRTQHTTHGVNDHARHGRR